LVGFGFVDPRLKPRAIFIGAFRAKHFPAQSVRHLGRERHQINFQLRQERPISLLPEFWIFLFHFYKYASPDGLGNPERGLCKNPVAALCERRWPTQSLHSHGGHTPPLQPKMTYGLLSNAHLGELPLRRYLRRLTGRLTAVQ
jgi:hypothetical protein